MCANSSTTPGAAPAGRSGPDRSCLSRRPAAYHRLALRGPFRYVRGVLPRSRAPDGQVSAILLVALLVALLAATAGCRHKSKTPEDAYQRFAVAVASGDGGALFD